VVSSVGSGIGVLPGPEWRLSDMLFFGVSGNIIEQTGLGRRG
jgi:hypothetical protein